MDSVVSPSGPLTFTYDGQFLRVALPRRPWPMGEEAELTVYYGGDPHRDPEWGGFYFVSNYIYNLGIGISTIPPNFGKVWYPCFDSFVERATYTYHVKSAGTFRLQGQGNFLGEVQLGGDTVIRSFDLPQAIPTHLSAIAVADYAEHAYIHTGAFGDIPVTLRAKPADLTADDVALRQPGRCHRRLRVLVRPLSLRQGGLCAHHGRRAGDPHQRGLSAVHDHPDQCEQPRALHPRAGPPLVGRPW